MLTKEDVERIVGLIKFRDWRFRVLEKGDGFLVQPLFMADDCVTGQPVEQHARKWYVSQHCCRSEVVQSVYAAIQRAVLHEVAEDFFYRNAKIYNPHASVDAIAAADLGGFLSEDVRKLTPKPSEQSRRAVVKDPNEPLKVTYLKEQIGPGPAPEDGKQHWAARPDNDPWF